VHQVGFPLNEFTRNIPRSNFSMLQLGAPRYKSALKPSKHAGQIT